MGLGPVKKHLAPDDDALILSFWLLRLVPRSSGLQELNFPGEKGVMGLPASQDKVGQDGCILYAILR